MAKTKNRSNLSRTLEAGLVAGFIAAALGNIFSITTQYMSQVSYSEFSIPVVTVAAFFLAIFGSFVYHLIHKRTEYTRDIITIIGLTIPTANTLYVLSNDYDAAFRTIAVSISYIVSLTAVILIPYLSKKFHAD